MNTNEPRTEACGCVIGCGPFSTVLCYQHLAALRTPILQKEVTEPGLEAKLRAIESKPALSLIPTQPLMEVGRVLSYSSLGPKAKYKKDLWREEPVPVSERLSSALRHIVDWNEGQEKDPGSGLHPIAHAITQLMMAMETARTNPEEDDRWRNQSKNTPT